MFYKRSLSIDNVYGDFLNFIDIQEYNSKKNDSGMADTNTVVLSSKRYNGYIFFLF